MGSARFAVSAVTVGCEAGEPAVHLQRGGAAAWLPMAADAAMGLVVAPDRPAALALLGELPTEALPW